MIFNSITYLLFLFIVVLLFWVAPIKIRLYLIFFSGTVFYSFWRPEFLLLMFVCAFIDYWIALRLEEVEESAKRRIWLVCSIVINLSVLCYFKYLFFVLDSGVAVFNFFGAQLRAPVLDIILPLGISFYTFETISYVVDVYRRFIPAEKSFLTYGSFIVFFPKLIAGPILRASEIIPQFLGKNKFHLDEFSSGLQRIIFGLFLKVVLADNIAPFVDDGFEKSVEKLSALDVWTLAFLFGFQIYFDFSAYSSIAIGSARLLGVHVPENFNFPYFASSPREFWRRWHISLSSWIRDYLYLPLLGKGVRDRSAGGIGVDLPKVKVSTPMAFLSLFITWPIMGLWHGANWTFVLWGIYHATFIATYRLVSVQMEFTPPWVKIYLGWIITLPIIMLGWIPFRAQSVVDVFKMWEKVFSPSEYLWLGLRENTYIIASSLLLLSGIVYLVHIYRPKILNQKTIFTAFINTLIMSLVIGLTFVFLRPINQFIYFQF